jgi:macrodomain Ter protein organizer (MatP/YcbG family)
MIVITEESVWAVGVEDPLDLLALLAVCAERRHTLLLDEKRSQQVSAWMDVHLHSQGALRRRIHQILEENRRRYSHASPEDARITVTREPTDWARARIKPKQAVRLLQRPLKLLVENSRNDGAFLQLMAEPADRRQLQEALEQGWIEFEMGGGIPEIRHRLQLLADAASNNDTSMIERARLWLMYDRDAHPGDRSQESEASREVRELAERILTPWKLKFHQLERRAIENYVPARTLRDWWCGQAETPQLRLDREQLAQAFLTDEEKGGLSAKARKHFNMKHGLLRDVEKKKREEISQGKAQLTDGDLDPLFTGLAPVIRERLRVGGGFNELSEAFSSPGAIDETAFSEENSPRERRRMLSSLFSRM